jgi:hypothetical protein
LPHFHIETMVHLDFAISERSDTLFWRDPSIASEAELRYDFLLGDLFIRVDALDFSAPWGWIPLLDAAACLYGAVQDLEAGQQRSQFVFTENAETISFERESLERVSVSCTYVSGRTSVAIRELHFATVNFSRRLLNEAITRYPTLRLNSRLVGWYPPVGQHIGGPQEQRS